MFLSLARQDRGGADHDRLGGGSGLGVENTDERRLLQRVLSKLEKIRCGYFGD